MPTYFANEGAFEVEDGALDHTVHHLAVEHPTHGAVDLVVHRAPFPEGKSLREVVAAHLGREREALSGYAVLEERTTERGGAPALEVTSRFRADDEAMYETQTHLALPDAWLYFALSAPLASRAACDEWSAQILGTLRLRAPE